VHQLFGVLPLFQLGEGEDIEMVRDTEMIRDRDVYILDGEGYGNS
jgi:hypothetical protein